MIKTKGLRWIFAALVVILAVLSALLPAIATSAHADSSYFHDHISLYEVVYDIKSDRTMHVCEDITAKYYDGHTGIMHYLPVNAGDKVKNVSVKLKDGDTLKDYPYSIEFETAENGSVFNDMYNLVMKITDGVNKSGGEEQTFRIEYDFEITKPRSDDAIYLNAIGFDWSCPIDVANVTLKLPNGYSSANLFIGNNPVAQNDKFTYDSATNAITATVTDLEKYEGITFELKFEKGALSTAFDPMPIIVAVIGCAVLAGLFAVKLLAFNKDKLTPIVNFTSPDDMDPLVMGKLIDNKVDSSDVTSLIYYWANKGYIKINLEDRDNPEFIRILTHLPTDSPSHQVRMYEDLFARGDSVTVNDLENRFYKTVDAVTKDVNSKHRGLYNNKSIAVSIIFALLGGLILSLIPIVVTLTTISSKLFLFQCLIMLIPTFIAYGLTESLMYLKLKISRTKLVLGFAGVAAICALCSAAYVLIMPDAVMSMASKIIMCVLGFAISMCSVWIICRTEKYTEQLNGIIGFKNFILYAEKDRLEAMLEDDPQLYYKVLPYAQVLNVTDKWEDKFKALTVSPPDWAIYPFDMYIEFAVISSILRTTGTKMGSKMVSRPSSSGMSGGGVGRFGGGGGFGGFGGFGGGGHGGGGGSFI